MHQASGERHRTTLMIISLTTNIGLLGFFKYFNFFAASLADALLTLGLEANPITLNIILPVGISFYTFQTLSYTIDIYRRQLEPTRDAVAFFAFVSFFPQLVAGPIERARNLLPQFLRPRIFDDVSARDGLRQILWGCIKKVVVADNIGLQADKVFADYGDYSGLTLVIGLFLFSVQVYCDFSGYSDIAIGTARLFGFNLMRNFAYPFFSRNITEYWRRWHISLSSWFRDYLYIPMGGSRVPTWRKIVNIVTTFTISGLWHGASWHFVAWGFINGIYFIPGMLFKSKKYTAIVAMDRLFPNLKEFLQMILTFSIITFSLIFLRSDTLTDSWGFIRGFGQSGAHLQSTQVLLALLYCALVIGIEWIQRRREHGLQIDHWPKAIRWVTYCILCALFLAFGMFEERAFYYFQF